MPLSQQWQENERQIIREFFEVKVPKVLGSIDPKPYTCSEDNAIEFAHSILATNDIVPVDNQGSNSLTLISCEKSVIIQFRLKPFKTEILQLAHKIYGDLVPQIVPHTGYPLPVYTSNIIPGRIHFLQDFPEEAFPLERQLKTVTELSEFIAKATWYPIETSHIPDELALATTTTRSWTKTAPSNVERLIKNQSLRRLTPELFPIVEKLQSDLPLLNELPQVLTHHDLAEINILVQDDGKVTGVIDFDAAGSEAFGICIWGIYECFLGTMDKGKYSFFDQKAGHHLDKTVREILEVAFWDTLWSRVSPQVQTENFKQAVRVAARVGVIERYFVRGMLDDIDLTDQVHRYSLEYARHILPAI